MAELGTLSLFFALILALYACVGSVFGVRRSLPELVTSARYSAYLTPLPVAIAVLALVGAFLSRDFDVKYVAEHSNAAMSRAYAWVAFYSGNEGSILFLAAALSIVAAIALALAPRLHQASLAYTCGTITGVLAFFLAVLIFLANPFETTAVAVPDGRGMNPLLTHPGMFVHPPMLMTGLVTVSIPFAFAIGSLLAGRTGDEWVDTGRTWALVSWGILGSGLLLGGWWAYTILGWGGFWAWDPVENAGFMPWLVLTAFVHSIMVQKRRGMFRVWNIALINVAFTSSLLGMFINRGGPTPSVHSFAESVLGMGVPRLHGCYRTILFRCTVPPHVALTQRTATGVQAFQGDCVPRQQSPLPCYRLRHHLGAGLSRYLGHRDRCIHHRRGAFLQPGQRAPAPGSRVPHGYRAPHPLAPGIIDPTP